MPPTIADDIETLVEFILENVPAAEPESRAALRVEAYLATYSPKNKLHGY